jgi:phosphopantothenoylcysteine decarboxylase/phosphopantothenate--cysteine ligase
MQGKKIIVGVTGGIAAYKAAELVSRLKKKGCDIKVVMTQNATQFVSPLTFEALSQNRVYTKMFNQGQDWDIHHISLAKWADAIVVAPTTANVIGKLANGLSDDLLTSVIMATRKPLFIAPAMNTGMYESEAVQKNMQILKQQGVQFIDANSGMLACGDIGKGRLAEPVNIVLALESWLQQSNVLSGCHVLVTAGPTREYIDPVRFLSNPSSGKMGYALAQVCLDYGAQVTLVSGPVHLSPPTGATVISVETAEQMNQAVMAIYKKVNIVFATAAVADYRPKHRADQKIKKETTDGSIQIEMERTPDILANMGQEKQQQLLIGFAAETNDIEKHAKEKLTRKRLDYIIANDITAVNAGFQVDTNKGTMYAQTGGIIHLPEMTKHNFARAIINQVLKQWDRKC